MTQANRHDFKTATKIELQNASGSLCSNPACRVLTVAGTSSGGKRNSIGIASHITAASPGGPRFDPELTKEERCSYANGIWLCGNCASKIDSDVNLYTVEVLQLWKAQAEMYAIEYLGKPVNPPKSDEMECGVCLEAIKIGSKTCKHCQSEIEYNMSRDMKEIIWKSSLIIGMLIAFFVCSKIYIFLPKQEPTFENLGMSVNLILLIIIFSIIFLATSLPIFTLTRNFLVSKGEGRAFFYRK